MARGCFQPLGVCTSGIFNQFSDSLLAPGQIRYLFHLLLYYYSFKDKQLCFRVKTHPLALISGFLSSSARESRASAQERITLGGEDHPLWNCSCSCQGVANKHQIYVHFERSTFTIGFLSGAVARERAAPRGAAWVLAPGSLELGAHRGALWAVPRAASPAAAAVPKLGYWRRCTDTRLWPPAPAAAAQRTNEPLPAISPRWQRCGKLSRWSRAAGLDGVLSSPRSCLSWQSLAGVPCFLLSTPFGLAAHRSPGCCPPLCQGAQAPELLSRVHLGAKEGLSPTKGHCLFSADPSISLWRLVNKPESRLTWRKTRSVLCLR